MPPKILKVSIEVLELSEELRAFMVKNGFQTLEMILHYSGKELLEMEGFSYRMLKEFLGILHRHDCLNLFKDN
ncbi:hypothetical protein AB832_06170 [Flavobacteriaceae bacterium (ex Bugula neritina AB1)]|nr:hypothetical protein AB832_06170 [Flavobacteriaceae bacterium (ex Bugula neritina AB1)]